MSRETAVRRKLLMALLAAPLFASMLAGCGSVPPAPVDRFYRLQEEKLAGAALPAAGLRIGAVRADSLYGERPIVFVRDDDARQLRQYHYHLWLYPPAQTVRDHLRAALGDAVREDAKLTADVRVVAFERVLDGGKGRARAALHFSVAGPGGSVLDATYRAEVPATADSFSAFGAAMEEALRQIYAAMLRDLAQLSPRS